MLTDIHDHCLLLQLTVLLQLLFTWQLKSFALQQCTFYFGDDAPALDFTDAIAQTNMKERTILPVVHQHHQHRIFHTQLSRTSSADMLAMSKDALLKYFHHLFKSRFLYSRQSLKLLPTDLLYVFPIHIPLTSASNLLLYPTLLYIKHY